MFAVAKGLGACHPMSRKRNSGAWSTADVAGTIGLTLVLLSAATQQARGVLVYGPQGRNLTAPSDPGQNQASEFEGVWQNQYLGTAIAPNYFITATHIGGQVGDIFNYQGLAYTTTAVYTDPNSPDLRIWRFNGNLTSYASLDNTNDELNQPLIAFGQGGARGNVYSFDGTSRGWQFTGTDTVKSWGTNQVDYVGALPDGSPTQYLLFKFDPSRGPNTASLSPGDSGGGVFVLKDGAWKLAGVNFAVDGPYYTVPPNEPNRNATLITGAIYDQRGLYVGDAPDPVPDKGVPVPANSYASRLSSEFGWIYSVTGVPEPSSLAMLAGGIVSAGLMFGKTSLKGRSSRARG